MSDKPNQRLGKFTVTRELLFQEPFPESFARKFIFVRIDWDWMGLAKVTALSPLFEVCEDHLLPPEYFLECQRHEDGMVTITAKREP